MGKGLSRLGDTPFETQTPVLAVAGAYISGDAVGGLLTFSKIMGKAAAGGVIVACHILDIAQQVAELELWLFHTSFTATTDNDAFDPTDADLANKIAVIDIFASDWRDLVDNSSSDSYGSWPVRTTDGNLYGQLRSKGTPTYTDGDLQVTLVMLGDVW